jgi:hypothetical protein
MTFSQGPVGRLIIIESSTEVDRPQAGGYKIY